MGSKVSSGPLALAWLGVSLRYALCIVRRALNILRQSTQQYWPALLLSSLVLASFSACSGAEFSADDGAGGNGTSGEAGAVSSAGGTSVAGSGTAGEGGQTSECDKDSECELATDSSKCCPGCMDAYSDESIDEEPCLVRPGESAPEECQPDDCTDIACPAIGCEEPLAAVCNAGKCEVSYRCPDGYIESNGKCIPRCNGDSDCVMASQTDDCCASCPTAMHRETVEEEPCLVEYGDPVPQECRPSALECVDALCPTIRCDEPGDPVCLDDGTCGSSGSTQ